jgi:hypothetical protein
MAVIQISKIQQRRGQTALTGFPQLASGEFGWSIDTQELYIGNGSVTEGAPAVGNTQLITEHNINNLFLFTENGYQYAGLSGVEDSRARVRTIHSKLDDELNLNDIVDLNTATYHTDAFKIGIKIATETGKPLVLPEFDYVVTGTIYIPSNVELRGAGPQKTVITNLTTASTFVTVDATTSTFDTNRASYGNAGAPRNIRINGITFVNSTTNAAPIMQLDAISDSIIEQCEFIGDISAPASTSSLVSAINFRDIGTYPANKTDNIKIKNCTFYKLNKAIESNYDIGNIIISENTFKTVDEGIVLGKTVSYSTGSFYGPQHVAITANRFDNIKKQAIYAGSTSTTYYTDINSTNNYFYDVGNNGLGDTVKTQAFEIIRFNSFGNNSTNDTFDRLNQILVTQKDDYLEQNSTASAISLIAGPAVLTSKTPNVYNITGSGSPVPMFVYPLSKYRYETNSTVQIITFDYTINKPTIGLVRKGTLDVVVSGTTATVKDVFTSNDDIEGPKVIFNAQVNVSRNLVVVYQNNQSTAKGNIIYTYTVRQ